jgi:ABC-type multidrug transport system ATPase subunit
MGPSGCGKSSLLDVLAGRIKQRFLSGTLTINGSPINFKSLKKDAGRNCQLRFLTTLAYVTQDDTLSGVLTVYENLWYLSRWVI